MSPAATTNKHINKHEAAYILHMRIYLASLFRVLGLYQQE